MAKSDKKVDQLFVKAEQMASDFELFPQSRDQAFSSKLEGLLPKRKIEKHLRELKKLDVDEYAEITVFPSEDKNRQSSQYLLDKLPGKYINTFTMGPLIAAEIDMDFGNGEIRRVGFIAQERSSNNGVWMPQHHLKACELIREYADLRMPVVTFIDTPGADAGEEANANNQAHAISRLIAEFAQVDIPTIGIVVGNGYSGGAIPLATTNILLCLRDGVFNTIQPRGLASIARKYDLSWQECAKYVGVSPHELYKQGYIDGIIDYVPGEDEKIGNLNKAIISGVKAIELSITQFTAENGYIYDDYQRSIERYLNPSSNLRKLQEISDLSLPKSPTSSANIFGLTCRFLRYLSLRKRIHHTTIESYGRLTNLELPKGDLRERTEQEHKETFETWLNNALEIKYDDVLRRSWLKFKDRRSGISIGKRTRVGQFFFGDPKTEYGKALQRMCLDYGFSLYNLWKDSAQSNFLSLINYLMDDKNIADPDPETPTILDVISQEDVRHRFIQECQNLLLFDLIYNNIIANLKNIAVEAKNDNNISRESIDGLLSSALNYASTELLKILPEENELHPESSEELKEQFSGWLRYFVKQPKRERILKATEQWKKIVFPRVSETLFAIITFIFEDLIPSYLRTDSPQGRATGKPYDGKITLRNIGIKDFWNRLTIAYHDLLIHDTLMQLKRGKVTGSDAIIEKFFTDFKETDATLMSDDPVAFPGFRISIEQALERNIPPCGIRTGIGKFKEQEVGIVVSNLDFQAGAFDMASAEKFCKLMCEAAQRHIPIICFISSGGMQTKEGAGSLFSMAIINDRITRFIRDNDLPIIMFGFGDCTGGAQASMVTHPLVQTYYFSGTNMPFAGQIVVPSYLPNYATLSNYLSLTDGAMNGLVKHPFAPELDDTLQEIDSTIPAAKESVETVIERVLEGSYDTSDATVNRGGRKANLIKPVKRVLIHARGCAASKLVKKAGELGIETVLVQSDPDMESVAASLLGKKDRLICIGGSTPDESYLNAKSVIRIAEREEVDALHPGIGFLSENPLFADLCKQHKINFIGPPVESMEWMGNKSNATNTARELKVPAVPGSNGVVTSSAAAAKLAEEIGYPVIIKAVHGGGGKGIQVVHDPKKFHELFVQISAEAKSAFGNSDVYLEKFVESMRHVEVQLLRDTHGNTKVLGLRDCSVQRNNQKIIEESGSSMLPENLEKAVYEYTEKIADRVDYVGAGTVEFIFDLVNEAVYFMEMNTRLQVEHPVTENVTGVDIVAEQFRIAGGESIEKLKFKQKGYAIELRVNAEKATLTQDGDIQFIPDPGKLTKCELPEDPNIDLISAIDRGSVISPYYDSMVLQIICTGKDREDTVEKLLKYLDKVAIRGVCTNIPMLKRILKDKEFRENKYDTGYLPAFLKRTNLKSLIKEIEKEAGGNRQAINRDALLIENSSELKVLAPSAGIFYSTPSPSEPDFVSVGTVAKCDQTLCLLEAMKLFRPISLNLFNSEDAEVYDSKKSYKIVRVNPANGQAVNAGDLLFVIKPV